MKKKIIIVSSLLLTAAIAAAAPAVYAQNLFGEENAGQSLHEKIRAFFGPQENTRLADRERTENPGVFKWDSATGRLSLLSDITDRPLLSNAWPFNREFFSWPDTDFNRTAPADATITSGPGKEPASETVDTPAETDEPEEVDEPGEIDEPEVIEAPEEATEPEDAAGQETPVEPEAAAPADEAGQTGLSALEGQVFAAVNAYRQEQGMEKLVWNGKIADAARRHSADMADGTAPFGHDGFTDRVNGLELGFTIKAAAENVAYNNSNDPVNTAVVQWLNSAGHKANIEGDYDYTGVGVVETTDGRYYFTQIFIR